MTRFLKPDLWKVALTILLVLAASILWRMFVVSRISDTFPLGFPFQFYLAWGPCPPGERCFESNGLYFVLDLVVWYIISALIVDRVRKR